MIHSIEYDIDKNMLNNATSYIAGLNMKKDYKKAKNILLPLCSKKIIGSCYLLSKVYFNGGYGLDKNISKSKHYKELSCKYGVGLACFNIAKDFFEEDKDAKGIYYLKKSCDNYLVKGCQALGLIYEGRGVNNDYKKAIQFYSKACTLQDSFSCYAKGLLYLKGLGTNKDFNEVVTCFEKACDLKNANSCYSLASIYYYGKYQKQDYQKAITLYKKSEKLGQPKGLLTLGSMYYKGLGVDKNVTKAIKLFKKCCDNNISMGCDALEKIQRESLKENSKTKNNVQTKAR